MKVSYEDYPGSHAKVKVNGSYRDYPGSHAKVSVMPLVLFAVPVSFILSLADTAAPCLQAFFPFVNGVRLLFLVFVAGGTFFCFLAVFVAGPGPPV
jgi:hypothetical protein